MNKETVRLPLLCLIYKNSLILHSSNVQFEL